jgi:hypothetical protein
MTAYEIRLKLLEIAKDLLIEKYNQDNEIDRINWQHRVNDAERTGDTPPAYQRFAHFPTEEDIVRKAKMLNQFVSSKGSEI